MTHMRASVLPDQLNLQNAPSQRYRPGSSTYVLIYPLIYCLIYSLTGAALLVSCTTAPKVAAPPLATAQTRAATGAGVTPSAVADAASAIVAARAAGIIPPPAPGEPRRYEDVVTKDAKTSRGMVLYHKVKERHYFEIPQALMGRDLLWSAEISQASTGVGSGAGFNGLSLGYKVVRFERVENRLVWPRNNQLANLSRFVFGEHNFASCNRY